MITINDVLQVIELSAKIAKTELAEVYIENNKELLDKLNNEEKKQIQQIFKLKKENENEH